MNTSNENHDRKESRPHNSTYPKVTVLKTIRFIILFFGAVALTGCTFYADFYIVNNSDKPVTAIIQFISPIDEYKNMNRELSLRYANKVLLVNDKTKDLLLKQLSYDQVNSNTVTFDIPEYSTVLVAGTYNRAIAADSLKFIINGTVREYTRQTISGQLKKSGGLIPPFHFTYTID